MAKRLWSPRPTLEPQIKVCWRLVTGAKVHKSRPLVGKAEVLQFARGIEGDVFELWAESDENRCAKFNPKTRKPLEGEDWLFIDY